MEKQEENGFIHTSKYEDYKETGETALDLIKQTLLLNPENQKLSSEDLEKLALEELKNSLAD